MARGFALASASWSLLALLCALARTISAEKVLLTATGGPNHVDYYTKVQLADIGSTTKSSKLLGLLKLNRARGGSPVSLATAGGLAFFVGALPEADANIGKTFITALNVAGSTPKVVAYSGRINELYNTGKLKGCPATGASAAVKNGDGTYSIYFGVACRAKCRHSTKAVDRSYIVHFKFNPKTKKFSGLQPDLYLFRSDPTCKFQGESKVVDIRPVNGKLYAVIQGGQKAKLVRLSNGKLVTVTTGSSCNGGGGVRSSTSFYNSCFDVTGFLAGVVVNSKGSKKSPIIGGKYTSNVAYGPFSSSSTRVFAIRGPTNSHNEPLHQILVAHSASSSKISTAWQPVLQFLPEDSWVDVAVV